MIVCRASRVGVSPARARSDQERLSLLTGDLGHAVAPSPAAPGLLDLQLEEPVALRLKVCQVLERGPAGRGGLPGRSPARWRAWTLGSAP